MKTSESVNEIQNALISFQSELTPVARDADGYGYKYATLDMVISHIQPLLEKHGLGVVQLACGADPGYVGLTTRLVHTSGEWLEEAAQWPVTENSKQSPTQNAGAAFTYARRYGILAALGVAAEDDTDAAPARQKAEVRIEIVKVYWKPEFFNRLREVVPDLEKQTDVQLMDIANKLELQPPYTADEMKAAKEAFEKYAADQQ